MIRYLDNMGTIPSPTKYHDPSSTNTTNTDTNSNIFVWMVIVMMFVLGICFFCICYILCSREDDRYMNQFHINFGSNDGGRGDNVNTEERREERRNLILSNVIHKKVRPREEDEGISLPHEKEISTRKMLKQSVEESMYANIISSSSHHSNSYNSSQEFKNKIELKKEEKKKRTVYNHHNHEQKNLNNASMRSLRRSLNIITTTKRSESTSSIYSPKNCPICMESYHADDEVAWSTNEECPHAFHLDCMMGWLMDHDTCPMCREDYLNLGNNNA